MSRLSGSDSGTASGFLLRFVEGPHAFVALFVIAFSQSIIFPLPTEIAMVPLVLLRPHQAFRIWATACLGSVSGGIIGYGLGYFAADPIARPLIAAFRYEDQYDQLVLWYERRGEWVVFLAGISPFPYKLVTVTSGVLQMNFADFVIFSVIARAMRYGVGCFLLVKFGKPFRRFSENRLPWLMGGISLLVVISFMLLGFI